MPTKPTSTLPEWASSGPYVAPGEPWDTTARRDSTGLAGAVNDGFTPETPSADPTAEQENEWLHRIWEYVDWLRQGTFAADLDAHVLETDSSGFTNIARARLGATAAAATPLTVDSNASGAAAVISDTIGSFAVLASATGASAAVRGVMTGSAAGVEGIQVSGTGPGVFGDAGNSGSHGVDGDGGTGGTGVRGTSGTSGGFGVQGVAASGSPGVQGEGNASNSSSEGVQGVAGHDDAHGVRGFTSATANAGAAAVRGDGRGDGDGVHGIADDGHGVIAESDTTSPERSAFRIVPQDTDPNTLADGDIWWLDEGGADEWLKLRRSTTTRYVWDGIGPRIPDAYDYSAGVSSSAGTQTVATAQFQTRKGGDVFITARLGLSRSTAGTIDVILESEDNGGGSLVTHETGEWQIVDTTNNLTHAHRGATIVIKVTPPNNNLRNYRLITDTSGGGTARAHDASIRVQGEYA